MVISMHRSIYLQYQELQQYVDWNHDDVRRVKTAYTFLHGHLDELVDDFYAEIDRHPHARKVITGGPEQIKRLKGTLLGWLNELFTAQYDATYAARRWKVGWRHVEIGLDQVYTNMALSRLREGLTRLLLAYWRGDAYERGRTICSLNKLLDLDLAIIECAYREEYLKRQQQVERLAAIGQISAGVAHEIRNPLNVVKTSVYYLLHAQSPSPEKVVDHLKRIERQVEVADGVTTALSDFARLPIPQLAPIELEPCLREVLELTNLPEQIECALELPADLPPVWGDRQQLGIVFGNLIRNARDAMPSGGKLSIDGAETPTAVRVAVADTGSGIAEQDLARIHEPLFSTKARGMGLGLAITRSILEKHSARLEVESRLGEGSTFTVEISKVVGDSYATS